MRRLDIDLGDRQITFDHVQGGVTEDPLQGIDIPTIPQKVNSEGMPETMDGGVLYTCPFSKAVN